jgi:hypothetical protein
MAAPELVVHILSTAEPVGLTYLVIRYFSQVTRALLTLLAAIVAMFARDEKLRKRGFGVLGKLTGRDDNPTGLDYEPRDDEKRDDPPPLPKP